MVVGIEMTPPTTVNFSPTSRQPRAMKLDIQAQLNLLIKVGQEEEKIGSPDPLPYFSLPNLKSQPRITLLLTLVYLV